MDNEHAGRGRQAIVWLAIDTAHMQISMPGVHETQPSFYASRTLSEPDCMYGPYGVMFTPPPPGSCPNRITLLVERKILFKEVFDSVCWEIYVLSLIILAHTLVCCFDFRQSSYR